MASTVRTHGSFRDDDGCTLVSGQGTESSEYEMLTLFDIFSRGVVDCLDNQDLGFAANDEEERDDDDDDGSDNSQNILMSLQEFLAGELVDFGGDDDDDDDDEDTLEPSFRPAVRSTTAPTRVSRTTTRSLRRSGSEIDVASTAIRTFKSEAMSTLGNTTFHDNGKTKPVNNRKMDDDMTNFLVAQLLTRVPSKICFKPKNGTTKNDLTEEDGVMPEKDPGAALTFSSSCKRQAFQVGSNQSNKNNSKNSKMQPLIRKSAWRTSNHRHNNVEGFSQQQVRISGKTVPLNNRSVSYNASLNDYVAGRKATIGININRRADKIKYEPRHLLVDKYEVVRRAEDDIVGIDNNNDRCLPYHAQYSRDNANDRDDWNGRGDYRKNVEMTQPNKKTSTKHQQSPKTKNLLRNYRLSQQQPLIKDTTSGTLTPWRRFGRKLWQSHS